MSEVGPLRLLLVEDDDSVAEMYKGRLEQEEYVVDVARDGELALRLAMTRRFDLIFLDIQLPKLDGFGVLERLRSAEATRQTPVVILSNLSEAELRRRGQALGALEFLIKSRTTPGDLASRVDFWSRSARIAGDLSYGLA